jgi:thiosulfate/3-mercaptopyruvate sulfurtransferase
MSSENSPLITAKELNSITGNVVIVDARSGPDAAERFSKGHYPGAIHADLDKDLSKKSENAANGGRHPLPPIYEFSNFLGSIGITPNSHVIVYDDKSGANAAARFWWMLRAVGHENVQVVDGGLDAIIKSGKSLQTEIVSPKPASSYSVSKWKLPMASMADVEKATQSNDQLVVDVRESYRYRGEKEPIDLVAGHIPGAVNFPYVNNLNQDGTYKEAEQLRTEYKKTLGDLKPENVIVHCGSGVTACHTLLALEHAGLKNSKLYVGSWSEWSRNDKPIATGGK